MSAQLLLLSFPLIFIFHDMEEIVGMKAFLRRNGQLLTSKIPRAKSIVQSFSTEGFALAVYEELVLSIVLSITALMVESTDIFLNLWLGAYIGCAFHFVVHIGQSIAIRKYIPALITSIICLPISIYIIKQSMDVFLPRISILCTAIGFVLVFVNLAAAHRLMAWYGKRGDEN
ncbi:MAG: HXXEE domain-containing protein [Bacteroidales bacterium]|nr:HXXEE domain-containing protein [Bacteroidales bacterium]